jgi:glycerol-3-phosphate dehydrogenase subunit C
MNDTPTSGAREGNLEAPTRHPLDWKGPEFHDRAALFSELERVFDICHGCRRCFSLCQAFPTLFDAIDATPDGELHGVPKKAYWQVVDNCYLCDMCYMTKCPYVPPHPWNVDFPHVMLRAKVVKHAEQRTSLRDRLLSSTDAVGRLAGIPVVAEIVNAANRSGPFRKLLAKTLGVHADAPLPEYHSRSFRKDEARRVKATPTPVATDETRGKVVLFATCYCNRNEPAIAADLVAVFEHNGIPVRLLPREKCCGMPKLELGDLNAVEALKDANVPELAALVDLGYDIVAPVPSCVLMFKQELPLLFAGDAQVQKVRARTFDPFEYLMLRHKAGQLRLDFTQPLGKVAYHVPCHLRVQNIGLKTRDVLRLVPGTSLEVIERCSGHDGTYAMKQEFHESSVRIGRPVVRKVAEAAPAYHSSDCPMAGRQISAGLDSPQPPTHPLTLLRMAYGLAPAGSRPRAAT